MRHSRGIVAAFSCSTTSASSQITNRRDRTISIFTLGPSWLGALRPPTPPGSLHSHSYTRLHRQQWQLNVALSVMPFCRTATNDPRVNHFSLNRLSRSETIAGWGSSAPQHPPARCARVPLPVTSSTSDDTTYNNFSQTDSSIQLSSKNFVAQPTF
jgi:hypothetical protein